MGNDDPFLGHIIRIISNDEPSVVL